MRENEHLAIASVPVQSWDRVYEEGEALENGTVFPSLNKPFFATALETGRKAAGSLGDVKQNGQNEKLLSIQKVSFMADDLRLYMDTHPEDAEGLKLLKTVLKRRKELLREYALQFYPLTMDCMADIYEEDPESVCYCWQKGPVPWEGACV